MDFMNSMADKFKKTCLNKADKTSCNLRFEKSELPITCQNEINYRQSTKGRIDPLLFLQAQCQDLNVEIPYTSYSISRSKLGILVVSMDVIIIVSLLIAFQVLAHFEKRENQDYDTQTLTTEDFTVSLKNLPSKS